MVDAEGNGSDGEEREEEGDDVVNEREEKRNGGVGTDGGVSGCCGEVVAEEGLGVVVELRGGGGEEILEGEVDVSVKGEREKEED